MTHHSDLYIIDVRSEREFQMAGIVGAINLPLPQVADRVQTLITDRAAPISIYCASGARSGMACMLLRQLGYSAVTNAGGLYEAAHTLRRSVR